MTLVSSRLGKSARSSATILGQLISENPFRRTSDSNDTQEVHCLPRGFKFLGAGFIEDEGDGTSLPRSSLKASGFYGPDKSGI